MRIYPLGSQEEAVGQKNFGILESFIGNSRNDTTDNQENLKYCLTVLNGNKK